MGRGHEAQELMVLGWVPSTRAACWAREMDYLFQLCCPIELCLTDVVLMLVS